MPGPAARLAALERRAKACRRCPAVAAGSAVIGPRNGPVPADLLFVAEAPGYLGAVRTGVPLTSDRSGKNFRAYCAAAGIDAEAAFICNAVLCHPRAPDGRNRTPRASEVAACNDFLAEIVALTDPLVVVALGRVALDALGRIAPHGLRLTPADAGRPVAWRGRRLVALYHPSGQTLVRRSRAEQIDDYRAAGRALADARAARG